MSFDRSSINETFKKAVRRRLLAERLRTLIGAKKELVSELPYRPRGVFCPPLLPIHGTQFGRLRDLLTVFAAVNLFWLLRLMLGTCFEP
jgi:hypothetical protein